MKRQQFHIKGFKVILLQIDDSYEVTYLDSTKDVNLLNKELYSSHTKALFYFDRLVESCLYRSAESVKDVMLYYQNERTQKRNSL